MMMMMMLLFFSASFLFVVVDVVFSSAVVFSSLLVLCFIVARSFPPSHIDRYQLDSLQVAKDRLEEEIMRIKTQEEGGEVQLLPWLC